MSQVAKKRKTEAQNAAQFSRTVRKTGKWRGHTPESYEKKYGKTGYRSRKRLIECDHLFTDGECVKCHQTANSYYLAHPKKLEKLKKDYLLKKK